EPAAGAVHPPIENSHVRLRPLGNTASVPPGRFRGQNHWPARRSLERRTSQQTQLIVLSFNALAGRMLERGRFDQAQLPASLGASDHAMNETAASSSRSTPRIVSACAIALSLLAGPAAPTK